MSSRTRNYVKPAGVMFRASSYDVETGWCVRSAGPYSTRGAAMRQRRTLRRDGVRVVVEVCIPTWVEVNGTELEVNA